MDAFVEVLFLQIVKIYAYPVHIYAFSYLFTSCVYEFRLKKPKMGLDGAGKQKQEPPLLQHTAWLSPQMSVCSQAVHSYSGSSCFASKAAQHKTSSMFWRAPSASLCCSCAAGASQRCNGKEYCIPGFLCSILSFGVSHTVSAFTSMVDWLVRLPFTLILCC